jgi:hypothetical protein
MVKCILGVRRRWPAAVVQLILTVRDTRRRPGQHESGPPATRHEARHPASPIGRLLRQPTRQGGSGHVPNPPTYLLYDAVALLNPDTRYSSAQVSRG